MARLMRLFPLVIQAGVLLVSALGLVGCQARGQAPPPHPQGCLACHQIPPRGFAPGHGFAASRCTACHRGDPAAPEEAAAHAGMIASPGELWNAPATCGACHPGRVAGVIGGAMHTGAGMVNVTRYVLGEQETPEGDGDLEKLGHSPADSLLRKLCAGCHLGQPKSRDGPDPVTYRGGGCLACHLSGAPAGVHPTLSPRVRDERCLGCHARSSRISLSYAGLAEVDDTALARQDRSGLGRLADGRLVEHRPRDVHHRAGMGCIDCHTGTGLMGGAGKGQGVDIQCADCHDNRSARIGLDDWPPGMPPRWIPYPISSGQRFLTTARSGSVLWHVEVRGDGLYLHPKLGGPPIRIPELVSGAHRDPAHARLTCQACHARWAPQCYGCHLAFDSAGRQWDQASGAETPGRWVQRRWDVRNGAPPLGVTDGGRVVPFVPGMVLTAEHPDWDTPRFRRLFGPIAPHTTGPSRSCASCHNSPVAVGLGAGTLHRDGEAWVHKGRYPLLQDGLAADAWTSLSGAAGESTRPGARPFTPAEIRRILDVGLTLDTQAQQAASP
jgi:hypothetical protein